MEETNMAYTPIQVGANGADAVTAINTVAGLYDPATETMRAKNLEVSGNVTVINIPLNVSNGLTMQAILNGYSTRLSLIGTLTSALDVTGDVTIGTLPATVPKPLGTSAHGYVLDISTGSLFSTIRVNSAGAVILNANGKFPNGDYLEGQVNY